MSVALENLTGPAEVGNRFREHAQAIFAPPEDLTGSEWADKYRVISPGNPEPGPWRTDRAPYLREIMDVCTDQNVGDKRVVFMKSARVGGTQAGCNVIGFYTHEVPSQMLVVQPIKEDAEGFSKEQLKPMIDDTPVLRETFYPETGRRDSRNTILKKSFPGGFLVMVGSNSASGFRRRDIQRVFLEEVDGYGRVARGSSTNAEGDPVTLAVKRTQNYDDRLIYENSTPTIKGQSRIEHDYNLSDQRRYYVPCPFCGHMQVLKWRNLRWEDNDPATVAYTCGEISKDGELKAGCGKAIEEHHKQTMLRNGEWRASHPGRRIIGFHIWAAYSPFTTWERLVEEWLNAQGNNELLQVFVNTVLGETWEGPAGEQIDHTGLLARRERYTTDVPAGVGLLTVGTDVQGDRLEVSIWGWGAGEEQWLIDHKVLWGDPHHDEVWRQLDVVLKREWKHASGADLRIRAMGVDAGGHHTLEVHSYCAARFSRGVMVMAMRGANVPGAAALQTPSPKSKAKGRLWTMGTEALKDLLYARLKLTTAAPGYVHFPIQVEDEYFRQLASEKAVTRYVRSRPVRQYQLKAGHRNEALDCAVLALAALIALGPIRDHLGVLVDQVNEAGRSGRKARPAGKRRRQRRAGTLSRGVEV